MIGEHGAGQGHDGSRSAGTGVIAGGPMRAGLRSDGHHRYRGKSHGSTNRTTWFAPTFDALKRATTAAEVAAKRGKTVEDIFN